MPIYYNPDATDEEISECIGDYYGCEICCNQGRCFSMLRDKLEATLKEVKVNETCPLQMQMH